MAWVIAPIWMLKKCIMTSYERHQRRYERRCAKRKAHKEKLYGINDNYEAVFTYDNLYNSYKKCVRNVGWKASTQRYKALSGYEVYDNYRRLQNHTFHHDAFFEFDICERGKVRHIRSVTVRERVVQRCLCDYALVPLVTRSFIYDNGASMKNKGYTFSKRRMKTHLHQYYRKYGNEGYALLFDFSKFFDNVSHENVFQVIDRAFTDQNLRDISKHFVTAFGDKGLGLGSQISQVLALASANRLDHYVKEVLQIKYYARYMDDGYLLHPSKEYLQHCLEEIKQLCNELGIVLNEKKTRIVKISHGFSFLKTRFYLLDNGKIVTKIYKRSITKMRRKMKKYVHLVQSGKMKREDVDTSMQSWSAYAKTFDAFHTLCNMEKLYRELFLGGQTQ